MLGRLKNWWKGFSLSLKTKLVISLSAIAIVLLITSIISILEYRSMSNYLSDLIADDTNSIKVAQSLADAVDNYNLQILTVIGDESLTALPDFDQQKFVFYCDSLSGSFTSQNLMPLVDSVLYSYSAYMLTSLEMEDVILSDFTDSRAWYFERLQPVFTRLRTDIEKLSAGLHGELQENSENFQAGFYRSIIPGVVSVAVGILLVFMLMFYIITYYVNPLNKMAEGLDNYLSVGKKYTYEFDGDDELAKLNSGIQEITEEDRQLRRRIKALKERTQE